MIGQDQNEEEVITDKGGKNEDDTNNHAKELKVDINDPLGLLTCSNIAAAAADASIACNSEKSRKRKYKTEQERLEANRKSAAESRQRKKMQLEELQEAISILREENTRLRLENDLLKQRSNMTQNASLPLNHNPVASILGGIGTINNTPLSQPQNLMSSSAGIQQSQLPYQLATASAAIPASQLLNNNQNRQQQTDSLLLVRCFFLLNIEFVRKIIYHICFHQINIHVSQNFSQNLLQNQIPSEQKQEQGIPTLSNQQQSAAYLAELYKQLHQP